MTLLLGSLMISARKTPEFEVPSRFTETPISSLTQTVTPMPQIPASTVGESDSRVVGLPNPTKSATPEKKYQLCSPLAEHEIRDLPSIQSDPYAPPSPGKDDRHHGVDFAYYNQNGRESIKGEGITAILMGRVVSVLENRLPYGNMVIIETQREDLWPELIRHLEIAPGESLYHLYAHFGQPSQVVLHMQIECGQLIGEVGKTGYNIPIPHLHLEMRIGPEGAIFERMAFYDTRAVEEEMSNYKLWRTSGVFRHIDPMNLFVNNWPELSQE